MGCRCPAYYPGFKSSTHFPISDSSNLFLLFFKLPLNFFILFLIRKSIILIHTLQMYFVQSSFHELSSHQLTGHSFYPSFQLLILFFFNFLALCNCYCLIILFPSHQNIHSHLHVIVCSHNHIFIIISKFIYLKFLNFRYQYFILHFYLTHLYFQYWMLFFLRLDVSYHKNFYICILDVFPPNLILEYNLASSAAGWI